MLKIFSQGEGEEEGRHTSADDQCNGSTDDDGDQIDRPEDDHKNEIVKIEQFIKEIKNGKGDLA